VRFHDNADMDGATPPSAAAHKRNVRAMERQVAPVRGRL